MVPISLSFSLSCLLGAYTVIPLGAFYMKVCLLCLSYLSCFRFEGLDQLPFATRWCRHLVCLDQRRHGSARTCSLHCTLTPAACAARSARSVPGQDTRSGQGALARRHTDGPLWAALLKTTVMCEAWRRHTIAPQNPSRTADRPKPNSPYPFVPGWVLVPSA
jgi:hypothetical protein